MEQLKVGGVTKDYVKIAYQGTDCLYVPATQLDLVSKYIGAVRIRPSGSTSSAATSGKRQRRRPRLRPRIWLRASSSSMPSASACRASPSRRIRRGSRSLRRALNTPKRTISCAASTRSSATWNPLRRWTVCSAATSASANGGRAACGHEVYAGRQAGRDLSPDDRSGPAALSHGHAPLCDLPGHHRCAFPLPYACADQKRSSICSPARSI